MQSIFLTATNSAWYAGFMKPVVDTIICKPGNRKILDIGTGPGTLPRKLAEKDAGLQIIGVDINTSYIDYARNRSDNENVTFLYLKPQSHLDFRDSQFDVVTFCSVLFLLNDKTKKLLMDEALRMLKPRGEIIILSPSGKRSGLTSPVEGPNNPFSSGKWTFYVWKNLTSSGGRKWINQKWPEQYAKEHHLNYTASLTFNNHAFIERISRV